MSEYKDRFVLKGGMLVAAIVGLDNRATMDLDTTIKNLPLTLEPIKTALSEILTVSIDDGVVFEMSTISPIREDDIYGGYRIMINANFDTMVTPLSIDISTGDVMTPHAVKYQFTEIFEALKATAEHRGTTEQISNTTMILEEIKESSKLLRTDNIEFFFIFS